MKVSCLSEWLKRYYWRILLTFAGTGAGIYFALNWLLSINPFPVERLEASPESGVLVDRYGRVLTRTLTKEEQDECSPSDLALYQKFQKRREYLTEHGFKDHYVLTDAEKSAIEDALNGMYNPSATFFSPLIAVLESHASK